MPSAFMQTNVFTFGQAPQSNYAKPGDPIQIYFAQVSPTVIKSGLPITVSVITTTNASAVQFGYGSFMTALAQTAPGQWQSTFNFNAAGIPYSPGSPVQMIIRATRQDGALTSVPVPLTVVQ
jgi:hypothetical protein